MSPPFKKCDVCGGKVPVQDPHSSCLLCLGKNHDPKACPLCKSLSSQARKNRESRLTLAIDQGKIQEGGTRSSSAPSAAPHPSSSRASVPSVVSAPPAFESISAVDVARGSNMPSATNKPSKCPHKTSGTEGSEPKSVSGRKASPEGSRSKDRASSAVRTVAEAASKSPSKSSRPASRTPRARASLVPPKRAAPSDGSKTPGPKPAGSVALVDLPDNPFFPSEERMETPRSSKKRHSKEDTEGSAPKRAKSSREQGEPSSKDKESSSHKSCSPTKKVTAGTASHSREPSASALDTPLPSTVDFVCSEAETVRPSRRASLLPDSHSEDDGPSDEDPDMFFDEDSGRYYMSVSRETAFKKFNLRPAPRESEKASTSHAKPSASAPSQGTSDTAFPLIPARPAT